jgi:RNA polymerase sigma-70 factor, ECF subfamily
VAPVSDSTSASTLVQQQVSALYAGSREGVFRYLLALGLDAAKAQEIAQDAFVRLYTGLRDGASIEDPKSWVYRVAHNLGLNSLSRSNRESPYDAAIAENLADPGKNPEQELIEKQWTEGVQAAIKSLSKRQRLCLELRCEGLEYRQIAEVLGIQPSTVAEFVRRGIRQLRRWNQWQK